MTAKERKQRIDYLWGRVRSAVGTKAMLSSIQKESLQKNIKNFGLDPNIEYALPEE